MLIADSIYGQIEIQDPLIIELINSKPFQRLKGIHQTGATYLIQPSRTVTRYEHSIGTWFLSFRYHRSLTEQVASLLHDLPHTAFSHVFDYVFPNKEHTYHDNFLEQIIKSSEIPKILKKHHLNLHEILDSNSFPLLSNKLPDISFDRWDYFMRDGFTFGLFPSEIVTLFLDSIEERGDYFYFEDISKASLFAILFLNCFRLNWTDPTGHGSYFLLANALKIAVNKNILSQKDFFTTDNEVLKKLRLANDKEISNLLGKLAPGKEFLYANQGDSDYFGPNKIRLVDPLVNTKQGLKRVSKLIPGLEYYLSEVADRYKAIGVKQLLT